MAINPQDFTIQIYSEYEGWSLDIKHIDSARVVQNFRWNHEDFEAGVGGEKLMAQVFKTIGYSVSIEDYC